MRTLMLTLLICFPLGFIHNANAQKKEFTTTNQAVQFLNEMCSRYWLPTKMEREISHEVTVYQHMCQLFFNEKIIVAGAPGSNDEAKNQVINILTSVNLPQAKNVGNMSRLEVSGNARDVITVSFHGGIERDNKGAYSSNYRIPLDYNNSLLRDQMYDLNAAINFLLKTYHNQCRKN